MPPTENRFAWIEFYQAVADKLLDHRSDRKNLVQGIHGIFTALGLQTNMDRGPDGEEFPWQDICPFTAMGIFNRIMHEETRRRISAEFADFLGVEVRVPRAREYAGIPTLVNYNPRFFPYEYERQDGQIDAMWNVFAAALRFADSDQFREEFVAAYDKALKFRQVSWNLSMGLYWARPLKFLSLDKATRDHFRAISGLKLFGLKPLDAQTYLSFMEAGMLSINSFPGWVTEAREAANKESHRGKRSGWRASVVPPFPPLLDPEPDFEPNPAPEPVPNPKSDPEPDFDPESEPVSDPDLYPASETPAWSPFLRNGLIRELLDPICQGVNKTMQIFSSNEPLTATLTVVGQAFYYAIMLAVAALALISLAFVWIATPVFLLAMAVKAIFGL